ncbi:MULTISPECIES: CaiB/BaiF CoA transferase family protein [Methylobacterium]|uniref:CaiB/BaiF CoA transferase family protein n=1 Tax=Methylobacterium TaxID=407 RepID=UPI0013EC0187|nr:MULTISPECIES: CaiB/BaiF CoA-transferase family protein [unclassified Methylobacterium]NGM38009.1 CoA transferase [Methylobacterium sp. DB0501]
MGALTGLRVLDLSRVLAGPWCSQILADLGAEVIKIERPRRGDDTRDWGPPWMKDARGEPTRESSYYQSTNRGKYSVAIDIASVEGQELLRILAMKSDVLVENYKAGSLAKYGLDYETLSKANPRLVYCSVTGFGQTGPRAAEPGYDFIIQGLGGLMSITGERDDLAGGGPQKVGVAVADLMTGLYAVVAIEAALLSRHLTGRGQHVDMALFDVQIAMLCNQSQNFLASGRPPGRYGNAHANIVPYQVFRASDADFVIACGNDSQFVSLCKAIGLPDLPKDPRFARNSDRVVNRVEVVGILAAHFLTGTAEEWIGRIHPHGVPIGPINDVAQALDEPQVKAREMLVEIPHPLKTDFMTVGSPIKMSGTPVEYPAPPPMLGEHTASILRRLAGVDDEQLGQLERRGAVGLPLES